MANLDPRLFVDSETLLGLKNQAKRLSLSAQFRPSGIFSGQNRSKLRGQGLSFEELRGFRIGDNIKNIDWKASSRANNRVVKVFTQETDRPALVVCDQRENMFFGSRVYMKSVVAAHLAALMSWLLHQRGDRVGGVVLGEKGPVTEQPSRMAGKVSQLVSSIADINQSLAATDSSHLNQSVQVKTMLLESLHLLGSSGTLVLVTDGLDLSEGDLVLLKRLSSKHNVIILLVNDELELDYQAAIDLVISDGQRQITLDDNPKDLVSYRDATTQQLHTIHKAIQQTGLSFGRFNTVVEPYLQLTHLLRGQQ
ncbi:DUF58 domain-containing protein [Vibrio harveyi]